MFQNVEQVIYPKFRTDDMHRESSDELRFKTEVDEVFRCNVLKILCCLIGLAGNLGIETDFALMHTFLDNIRHTGERTADNKKDVPCIDDLFIDLTAFLEFHGGTHL